MSRTVMAFQAAPVADDIKSRFIDVLTSVQGVPLSCSEKHFTLDFRSEPILAFLREHKVLTDEDLKPSNFFTVDEYAALHENFVSAAAIIERADPNLLVLINQLIATFALYDIKNHNIEGGSVSACIGMVYLCPEPSWDPHFYAEMMVHEYVHNSLFLDDMVNGIFPDLLLLKADEVKVTSSIRRTRREYDKSFHAACVSATLAYFYHQLGDTVKVRGFIEPLSDTVRELNEVDTRLQDKGIEVITNHARKIKRDLTDFMADRDFSRFQH